MQQCELNICIRQQLYRNGAFTRALCVESLPAFELRQLSTTDRQCGYDSIITSFIIISNSSCMSYPCVFKDCFCVAFGRNSKSAELRDRSSDHFHTFLILVPFSSFKGIAKLYIMARSAGRELRQYALSYCTYISLKIISP